MKQEEEKNRLSSKEKLFCCHYVITGNAKESALRAGFSGNPQRDGAKLLSKKEINDEIMSLFHQKEEYFIHRGCLLVLPKHIFFMCVCRGVWGFVPAYIIKK